MIKRLFDFTASLIGLIILSPLFALVSILIILDSKGPVFYSQSRVGRHNKDFKLVKFRTMRPNADKSGLLTTSSRDKRITQIGYYLRKYKIDELPQLLNVIIGDMSLVGPRPEVRKYVNLYTQKQLEVLDVKPGITDLASIRYSDENLLLGNQINPEQFYIDTILQDKLNLTLEYVRENSFLNDLKIIYLTVIKIFR